MPTQADTPSRPPRRSRRPPRKTTGPISSHVSSSQDGELSAGTETEKHSIQPTRILRRGDPDTTLEPDPVANLGTPIVHTPPRPKSMFAGSTSQQQYHDSSASETPQNKKKDQNSQKRKQSGPVSPMPVPSGSPLSVPRRESATPSRMNGTPVKAYAGPTFHASPAASSLPMPKFYSKSVPSVDKTKSLKSMMDQESPASSSGSEESPSLENIQPLSTAKGKEESPLDIFFRADRKAKGSAGSTPDERNGIDFQSIPYNPLSPSETTPRHHFRQTSVGGMFSPEMDGASPKYSSNATSLEDSTVIPKYSPSPKPASSEQVQNDQEEYRKAQTIALKKLLYSPKPQIPYDGSAGQRPPSSKLRKELSMPTSPENTNTPELPASPTPSQVQNTNSNTSVGYKTPQKGQTSPFHQLNPKAKSKQSSPPVFAHDTMKTSSLEDHLRRILKLDVLGDGVTGH